MNEQQMLVDAIHDLARVVIACDEKIGTKAEAVRRLNLASMKPCRIASLLSIPAKDVRSQIAKMRKGDRAGRNNSVKGKRSA